MKEQGFRPQEPLSTADWLAATKEAGAIRKLVEGLDLESRRREQFESMMRMMDKVSGFQLSATSSYPLPDFVTYSNPESSLVLDIWDQPQAHPDEPNLQVRRLTIPTQRRIIQHKLLRFLIFIEATRLFVPSRKPPRPPCRGERKQG